MELSSHISGIYHDVLIGADGELLLDRGWNKNAIVGDFRKMLASIVRGGGPGIVHLAVGRGRNEWDAAGPPPVTPAAVASLETPAPDAPRPVTANEVRYLDESDNTVTYPTARLQIRVELPAGYPAPIAPLDTYPLREFGLFGRSGEGLFMINCVRHAVINKNSGARLIREIRLQF